MDAEHHLDEVEVTEMTQMISALSENGYTSTIVNNIYTDIGNVIMEALKQYDNVIESGDEKALYKLLGEVFIKSFENNDRDTLGLAQAFVLKATKALKESGSDFRLPFSAETVSGLFISTVSSMLNKKGIRRKYEGFAGVLTPSYNMMQYYRIGDTAMMYEKFTDLVREKGIQPGINPESIIPDFNNLIPFVQELIKLGAIQTVTPYVGFENIRNVDETRTDYSRLTNSSPAFRTFYAFTELFKSKDLDLSKLNVSDELKERLEKFQSKVRFYYDNRHTQSLQVSGNNAKQYAFEYHNLIKEHAILANKIANEI